MPKTINNTEIEQIALDDAFINKIYAFKDDYGRVWKFQKLGYNKWGFVSMFNTIGLLTGEYYHKYKPHVIIYEFNSINEFCSWCLN